MADDTLPKGYKLDAPSGGSELPPGYKLDGGGVDASGTMGAMGAAQATSLSDRITAIKDKVSGKLSEGYHRLTDIQRPEEQNLGGPARFLAGFGGGAMGLIPNMIKSVVEPETEEEKADFAKHGSKPIPGEITAERILGARQALELARGARDWLNPQTRPTWQQIKSVTPEALATGATAAMQEQIFRSIGNNTADDIQGLKTTAPAIYNMARDAGRATERAKSIDQGMTQIYQRGIVPLEKYKAAVRAEVEKHAQNVNLYDESSNLIKNGNQKLGSIDYTKTGQVAQDKISQVGNSTPGIEKIRQKLGQGTGTFADAKALLTDIGSEASTAKYLKNARGASVLWEMYNSLRDSVEDHVATNLGGKGGNAMKSWNQYRNEHRGLMEQAALIDDLMGGASASTGLEGLTNAFRDTKVGGAGRQTELMGKGGLLEAMDKYGVDATPLKEAASQGARLQESLSQERNLFVGKIRAMYDHPLAVGLPAVAAGTVAGSALGPLGHIVAPLLVAGKISKLLRNVDVYKILEEAKQKSMAGQEMGVRNPMQGPQEAVPPPPVPGGQTPPAAPPQAGAGAPPPGATPAQAAAAAQRVGGKQPSPLMGQPPAFGGNRQAQLAQEAAQPIPGEGKGATPAEVDDMQEAQAQAEERQLMAKKLQRTKREKKK